MNNDSQTKVKVKKKLKPASIAIAKEAELHFSSIAVLTWL